MFTIDFQVTENYFCIRYLSPCGELKGRKHDLGSAISKMDICQTSFQKQNKYI